MTIVEVVLAAIIAAVVVVLMGDALMGAFSSTRSTGSAVEAARIVEQASVRIQQDVTATQAPDRGGPHAYDDIDLGISVRTGVPLRGVDARTGAVRTLDVADVVNASDSMLTLRVPDAAGGGASCVRWRVVSGELVRDVLAYDSRRPGCVLRGPVSSRRVMVRRADDGGGSIVRPFSYVTAMPERGGGCRERVATWPTSPTAPSLARIIGVQVQLSARSGAPRTSRDDSRATRAMIRSRQGAEYQRAMGCIQ